LVFPIPAPQKKNKFQNGPKNSPFFFLVPFYFLRSFLSKTSADEKKPVFGECSLCPPPVDVVVVFSLGVNSSESIFICFSGIMSSICGDNEDILFGSRFPFGWHYTNAIVFQKKYKKMLKKKIFKKLAKNLHLIKSLSLSICIMF